MSNYFSNEDKYTYPNTSILRNLLDIKNTAKLEEVERKLTSMRIFEVETLIEKEKSSFDLLLKIRETPTGLRPGYLLASS